MPLIMTPSQYEALTNPDGNDEKKAKRQLSGTMARAKGEGFEAIIEARCNSYYRAGQIAHLARQTPAMKAIRMNNRTFFVPVKSEEDGMTRKPCDYSFVLLDGTPGIFDAKATGSQASFSWPTKQRHQLAEMRSLVERTSGKAVAFALMQWADGTETVNFIQSILGDTVRKSHGIICQDLHWLQIIIQNQQGKTT